MLARTGEPPQALHGGFAALSFVAARTLIARGLRIGLRFLSQAAILCVLFGVGTLLAQAFSLPLPGNLIGMLLLLVLLLTGVVRPAHVGDLAGLAVQHLNVFFIPFVVGLMAWTTLLSASGLAIGVSLVGSAVAGLAAAAFVARQVGRSGGPRDAA